MSHVPDWVLGYVIPGTMVRSKKDGLLLAAEIDSAKAELLDGDRWYLSPDLTFVRYHQPRRDEGAAVNEVSATETPAGCALRYPVRYARSDAAITPRGWPYAYDDLFDLAKEQLANERRRYRRAPDTQTIDDRDERSVAELMAGDPAAVRRLVDEEVDAARRRAASKPKSASPTGEVWTVHRHHVGGAVHSFS